MLRTLPAQAATKVLEATSFQRLGDGSRPNSARQQGSPLARGRWQAGIHGSARVARGAVRRAQACGRLSSSWQTSSTFWRTWRYFSNRCGHATIGWRRSLQSPQTASLAQLSASHPPASISTSSEGKRVSRSMGAGARARINSIPIIDRVFTSTCRVAKCLNSGQRFRRS